MNKLNKENNKRVFAFIDGASSGNPGKAGIGILILTDPPIRVSRCIGIKTNNQAEYTALITCLKKLKELNIRDAIIYSDSSLLVNQMNGRFKVKSKTLFPYFEKALKLKQELNIRIEWISREENKEADKLAKDGIKRCNDVNRKV